MKIPTDDFDFGFSAVSEDELKATQRQLQEQVAANATELEAAAAASRSYEEKLNALYKMITPLLKNLSKDDDNKEYIHWPDRQKKMKAFIAKVDALMKS
jgi:cell division protein FtsB